MISPTKVPALEANAIALDLVAVLEPHCQRIAVAGSLRRRKPYVADIEILFIPRLCENPERADLFEQKPPVSAVDLVLDTLIQLGLVRKRPNVKGVPAWGYKNKLGIHAPSGLAVDFFSATPENWFNYLVCRTGGMRNNVEIATAARARGWKWNPYRDGFTQRHTGNRHLVTSEREVFEFVGLHYQEPWERP